MERTNDSLMVKVLKPFGYHLSHDVGDVISIKFSDATELIKKGYCEIVVNNVGENTVVNREYKHFEDFYI